MNNLPVNATNQPVSEPDLLAHYDRLLGELDQVEQRIKGLRFQMQSILDKHKVKSTLEKINNFKN